MDEQQKFFKLLKYSNELKKNKESLRTKDPELFKVLLNFLVDIPNNIQYSEKEEYRKLSKSFLADEITGDDFSYSFMAIYEGIGQKLAPMKTNESLELANFLKPSRSELGDLLARIYGSCDSFSPNLDINMSSEKELKNWAQILLLELQK